MGISSFLKMAARAPRNRTVFYFWNAVRDEVDEFVLSDQLKDDATTDALLETCDDADIDRLLAILDEAEAKGCNSETCNLIREEARIVKASGASWKQTYEATNA